MPGHGEDLGSLLASAAIGAAKFVKVHVRGVQNALRGDVDDGIVDAWRQEFLGPVFQGRISLLTTQAGLLL
jgi:hypothetical protein